VVAIRQWLRRSPAASTLRLARLNVLARSGVHQDFRSFVRPHESAWQAALAVAKDGPRVLVATNIGGHFGLSQIDRMLAVALTLRGARVSTVLCDAALPACQMCEINLVPNVGSFARRGPPGQLCGYCAGPARTSFEELMLPILLLGNMLETADKRAAREFASSVLFEDMAAATFEGLPVGEHALAGTLRYFATGELTNESQAEAVARRFLEASALTALAYLRIIERERPDVIVAHHGIYIPQGIAAAVARAHGVRVVTWNPAYRKHCFIFSHGDTYHHTLMDEPIDVWREPLLTAAEQTRIAAYLASRRRGEEDWIRFHRDPDEALTRDFAALGIDARKPIVLALTNVFWDAQLHYPARAFPNQRVWLLDTLHAFVERPDLQLVVRVHPAEATGSPPSRQRAEDEIRRAFPMLPPNVAVVPPESAVSTYGLAECANAALIYATKTGVELAAMGLPVVVAGEAWARGKGFTIDVGSPAHYRDVLSRLPFACRLEPAKRLAALAYAQHFFFGRMIPIEFVRPTQGPRRFTVDVADLEALLPGGCSGLDVICSGILEGTPFIMPRAASP
jgi:hypothetical protein